MSTADREDPTAEDPARWGHRTETEGTAKRQNDPGSTPW